LKHTYFRKVLVLPDAGPKNPFQYLLVGFLRRNGLEVHLAPKLKLFTLFKAVNKTNPDVVYFDWIHSFILGKNVVSTLIKSLTFFVEIIYLHYYRSIPIIHTIHNIQNHNRLSLHLEKLLYRFFLLRCFKIRVYSGAVKKEVIAAFKLSPDRIYVVQDIPFHHYYPNSATKTESRLQLGIGKKDFIFLFFGRIAQYKGIENLIDAFIKIARAGDKLIIAGEHMDQKYFLKLKALSNERPDIIWYSHFIEKDSVQYFFNAANIVVLPFAKIDHSGSIDLSLSFARPVITLDTGANRSLLSHQKDLLFKYPSQLAATMNKAGDMDLNTIEKQNFRIADAAHYSRLLTLFQKSGHHESTFRHEYI